MRRSTAAITLTLLAGTGPGVAYCGGDRDTDGVLEIKAACVDRLGTDATSECQDMFQSARITHAATAPRFGSAEACHAATGAECAPLDAEPWPDGKPWFAAAPSVSTPSVFIPAMAGVMIGRALSDGTRGATPVYAGPPPAACPAGAPGGPACLFPAHAGMN